MLTNSSNRGSCSSITPAVQALSFSMSLILCWAVPFEVARAGDPQAAQTESETDSGRKPEFRTEVIRGKVTWLAAALKSKFGISSVPEVAENSLALVTDERLYPFSPGQLIGLLHFGRRGSDFRDQTVSSGWYTLRFGLQPIDGNHEGTSPTRDFLMMIAADQDDPNKDWEIEELLEVSAEAAGGSHPGMLCLLRATEGDQLTLRHDDRTDWWILHAVGTGASGDKTKAVPFDLVVVGHADE
jgi:hypothetical protein